MIPKEQKQILKMVEDGKINPDEALKLIRALESSSAEEEGLAIHPTDPKSEPEKIEAPEFDEIASNARRLWEILLWIGVSVIVLSAYWLYTSVIASNYGFWFYCALMPLLFGVLVLALFTGSRSSHWLYINVKQPQHEWPQNITFGFPLPLGLASWFLRNFGYLIDDLNHGATEDILKFLSNGFSTKEPLIVNVDEGPGGERVQVFIG